MENELISEADYESLPDEPIAKFIALEAICRRNLKASINGQSSTEYDRVVRMEYMAIVANAATVLGIDAPSYPQTQNPAEGIDTFMVKITGIVAGLRLKSGSSSKAYSVKLAPKTRALIEQQIQKLRILIEAADMPEAKRVSMLKRLEELRVELSQSRVSFAKVMSVLAHVSVGIVSGTTFLAEAPHAIVTIHSLLGSDKQAEDAEAHRLRPPARPKALPAPAQPKQLQDSRMAEIIDDDIPF